MSGVRFQQLENHKYQNTNTKQITMTDPPEADQTDDPLAFVPNSIISDGQKFGQRYDTTALSVLVIGY